LSDDLQTQLLEVIGAENMHHAHAWALHVKWLQPGQDMTQIEPKNARAIIQKGAEWFRAKLAEFVAKQGGNK